MTYRVSANNALRNNNLPASSGTYLVKGSGAGKYDINTVTAANFKSNTKTTVKLSYVTKGNVNWATARSIA